MYVDHSTNLARYLVLLIRDEYIDKSFSSSAIKMSLINMEKRKVGHTNEAPQRLFETGINYTFLFAILILIRMLSFLS